MASIRAGLVAFALAASASCLLVAPRFAAAGKGRAEPASGPEISVLRGLSGRLRRPGLFRRRIDPLTAYQRLQAGKTVIVEHPLIGTFRRQSVPAKSRGFVYSDDAGVARKFQERAMPEALKNQKALTVRVRSLSELIRFASVEGIAPQPIDAGLSAQETRAAEVLRRYRGVVHGTIKREWRYDDNVDMYGFKILPDRFTKRSGLYEPGAFGRRTRLSVYSALERLRRGSPVVVRLTSGAEATITRVDDVANLEALLPP